MSIYWFLKDLWNDIKTNIYKIFVWKTTEPQSEISKHPNPHLIFWLGFGVLFYSLNQQLVTMQVGLIMFSIWIIFCYLLKRYWSGGWKPFMINNLIIDLLHDTDRPMSVNEISEEIGLGWMRTVEYLYNLVNKKKISRSSIENYKKVEYAWLKQIGKID